MTIKGENIGKRFEAQWIFRNISFEFKHGGIYAVTGKNGSGKSTLLKTIAGFLTPNEGSIKYMLEQAEVAPENAVAHLSFTAPYMDLIDELTVREMVYFHASVRKLVLEPAALIVAIRITDSAAIRNLSSGMRQRLKLALAIFTDSAALFLDEPTANFDAEWERWYVETLAANHKNRLVVIASNHPMEYESLAQQVLSMNA